MVLASTTTTTTTTTTTKASYNNNNEGNWSNNMAGYLLVFFHQQNHNNDNDDELDNEVSSTTTPTKILKRRSSSSLSPSHCSPLKNSSGANSNSNNALTLLSKTQSTLSVCALLFFATVLIFFVFEPATSAHHAVTGSHYYYPNRRLLRQVGNDGSAPPLPPALQGMGELYRRGSMAMTDLIVGHVVEGAEEREVRSFLRLLHHSGVLSKSDLVLVFHSPDSVSRLGRVVKYECDSFAKLVELYRQVNATRSGLTRYLRPVGEDEKEAIWGKRGLNLTNSDESTRTSYGSVVSFEASELDPENSLSGFLDRIPMSIRRFACYPMLLGRLRRHYKHTVLVDVSNSLVLSDPFTRVRNRSSDSVVLWTEAAESTRRTRRSSAPRVDPRVIVGGARGVRRFATSALTEIVRAAVEHKGGKGGRVGSVTEAGLVSQLVHSSGHLLKNVNVVTVPESIPEASSLAGFNSLDSKGSSSGFLAFSDFFAVVRRGGGGGVDIDSLVRREICSSHELYSSVYRDCFTSK